MEKEKKGFKVKRITLVIIILIILFLAGNVFAALSGNNNIFFVIRDLVTAQEVEGKDELLTDRDEKNIIEYENVMKGENIISDEENDVEDKTTILDEKNNVEDIVTLNEADENYTKNIIKKYYNLLSKKETETVSIFRELELDMDRSQDLAYYTPENYKPHPENYMWTGIKYNDFINRLANFMNDKTIQEKFSEYVEYEEYLYCEENIDFGNAEYEVESLDLVFVSDDQKECTYDIVVKKGNETIEESITFGRGNGDFVIKEVQTNKKDNKDFTEENIKTSFQNYQELIESLKASPVGLLDKLGLIDDIDDYKEVDSDNYVRTDIKFEDYKKACLEYMTEEWFEGGSFLSIQYKVIDGYIAYLNGGATGHEVVVEDIKPKNDSRYIGILYTVNVDGSKNLSYELEFSVEEYNGRCVISSCDQ